MLCRHVTGEGLSPDCTGRSLAGEDPGLEDPDGDSAVPSAAIACQSLADGDQPDRWMDGDWHRNGCPSRLRHVRIVLPAMPPLQWLDWSRFLEVPVVWSRYCRTGDVKGIAAFLALWTLHTTGWGQLAPNAPLDQPRPIHEAEAAAYEQAIAPYVQKARESWPAARERYRAGLPRGETFFVTTHLRDSAGRTEQVFIRVTAISGDRITGTISNQIQLVQGFRQGQVHTFPDSDLFDWTITKPDGTEEGNLVGKFLDTYQPPASAAATTEKSPATPPELVAVIARAERRGAALAQMAPTAKAAGRADLAAARKLGAELCDFNYRQLTISDEGQQLTYLLGTTRRKTDLVAGRHFLLSESGVEPSTKSCFNLGTPPAEKGRTVEYMTVSHLMSSTPSEYHVYLTLNQSVPLIVVTERAIWLVQRGRIGLLELQE